MAALAAADGVVDAKERALLRMCARRWSVDWSKVESTLTGGIPAMGLGLDVSPGSTEAFTVLNALVEMAMVDGRIDRRERLMLEHVARRLHLEDRLKALVGT
jgi:tellurite resistance protein